MEPLKTSIYILSTLTMFLAALPLIQNDHWIFRIFEYPRLQMFVILSIEFIVFLYICDYTLVQDITFASLMLVGLIALGSVIYPYTPIAHRQMKSIAAHAIKREDTIRLLSANVYQYNTKFHLLLEQIQTSDPDVILLLETDEKWKNALKSIEEKYPYQLLEPLDNTYGLLFYSRYQLENASIKYMVEDDKPSVHAVLILPSGKKIQFYGIHPAPPAPQHNHFTTERDKELLTVGALARKQSTPTIVTGDLNDVAWSYTTELFLRTSELLDPRRGRGFFNTFHASYAPLRWPLDHLFCSPHFQLVKLHRLRNIGSDHFPLFVELMLAENKKSQHEVEHATPEEKALAKEKIDKEINA